MSSSAINSATFDGLDRPAVLDPHLGGGRVAVQTVAISARMAAMTAWASAGVATWPVPMAQMGS